MLTTTFASAQVASDLAPYLLRLQHGNAYSSSCVLLQKSGAYHLELEDIENTKVLEGSLTADELQQLMTKLRVFVDAVSEHQIEEPLITHPELLRLDIVRNGRWSEAKFLSAESQEPYRKSLEPLLRWLNGLHKLPHKELTEDAGKNNCLVPRKIALKKRSENAYLEPAMPSVAAPSSPIPPPAALLRVLQMSMKSGTAEQRCALVVSNGAYRAEQRTQKTGSNRVQTKIDGGQLTPPELAELQRILDDRALSEIRHRKTSRLSLPMSGEMLELEINRSSGPQDVVLSSTFNQRETPFFYSGDGNIASAQPLLKFLAEHVQNNGLGGLDPELRNECTEAP
ncbi:MAG TPA: hypothetical protein VJO35_07380 [Terriglobales bacterium]|nr:hypothetical protein [Terriglobales bacterium]